jgi:hypothetical protein
MHPLNIQTLIDHVLPHQPRPCSVLLLLLRGLGGSTVSISLLHYLFAQRRILDRATNGSQLNVMSSSCHHCGGHVGYTASPDQVIWCHQCVHDNHALLNSIGLTDIYGKPITVSDDGFYHVWGYPPNVSKLRLIPAKKAPPKEEVVSSAPENPIPNQPFDFEAYNGFKRFS